MNKSFIRVLSLILSVLTLVSVVTGLSIVSVNAADEKEEETKVDYTKYEQVVYNTPEEKLASMGAPYFTSTDGSYEMYANTYTGEIAIRNVATGQILFTNPYDISGSIGSVSTKQGILSQIIIRYTDNDTQKFMYSFKDASLKDQISIRKIKNGIRVEYIIGDQAQRKLVPRVITADRFETLIKDPISENVGVTLTQFYFNKFCVYFEKYDISQMKSQQAIAALVKKYPVAKEHPIYVFDTDASTVEINMCEDYIKTYAPLYTFDMMDEDHDMCGYESDNDKSPVFKMALEYTLVNGELNVRLPANGIRFDSSAYAIEYISILPYMGAGHSDNKGYTFYPDGAGALFRFEDLNTKTTTTISRKVYGTDYAYHEISGTYQKTVRYPVYGIVENSEYLSYEKTGSDASDTTTETVSVSIKDKNTLLADLQLINPKATEKDITSKVVSRGFVAILEEGESLAEIATYHAGSLSDYNTVMTYFNPRPKDSYDISDSISVTTSSKWTVVSNRKYTGDYKIKYIMLSDDKLAEDNSVTDYYSASWLGMAKAYRDYLVNKGVLNRMTDDDVKSDIPLYIETFGTKAVVEQIATFPVTVMKPLTTFADIKTMYDELSAEGIKNINFKMDGYANGGMYATVPYKLKWEKSVSKDLKFKDLLAYAKEVAEKDGDANLGLFPNFNFEYVENYGAFDGLSLKRDAVKTIDNRYTSKRLYSATKQKYVSYFQLAISPSMFSRFTEKFVKNFLKYEVTGISVDTLGQDLNSDFDEDDPYNREDNKEYTAQAMKYLSDNIPSVMTAGGNAFVWAYVDHIVDAYLDSSNYVKASNAVPFLGVVLHGYIQFAGSPMNKEGNPSYSILKAIENGAGVYFILSYRNTEILKEDLLLSQHYSIRYDIWKNDVVSLYNTVNNALSDVQTKLIIDHEFLSGLRVLDVDELKADIEAELATAAKSEEEYDEYMLMDDVRKIGQARAYAKDAVKEMNKVLSDLADIVKQIKSDAESVDDQISKVKAYYDKYLQALEKAKGDEENKNVKTAKKTYTSSVERLKTIMTTAALGADTVAEYKEKGQDILDLLQDGIDLLKADKNASAYVKTEMIADLTAVLMECQNIFDNGDIKGNIFDNLIKQAEDLAGSVPNTVVSKYKDDKGDPIWSAQDVEKFIAEAKLEKEKAEEGEEEKEEVSKYFTDNGLIVAVTYGGKDGNDDTPYKTFILNYNSFSVQVEYEGIQYIIPAGDFVSIMR